ncbi:MAG: pentapeptide repeat-containing protein [Firmicutes bacterium]|nr:pentapeptide repeat-containing protein [Bacillota bacterium]
MKTTTVDKSSSIDRSQFVGADLAGAELSGVTLEGANLEGADLSYANLKGANLKDANLKFANLKGANLKSAILEGTNLEGANLKGVNLVGVNLKGANIRCVSLKVKAEKDAEIDKNRVVKVAVPQQPSQSQLNSDESLENNFDSNFDLGDENISNQEEQVKMLELDYMELRALKIVVEQKTASASMLQKKLKMGFQPAMLIIDKFEELGFIGSSNSNKQHPVILSMTDYQQKFER